jgi:predicted Zn-ribbon and HTH transcriptional regulator
MEDKLKEIINKIVREEIMNELTTVDSSTTSDEANTIAKAEKKKIQTVQQAINTAKSTGTTVNVAEMARAAEVKYTLKPDFRGELESVQGKLSKSEFRSLVDIVKVLKDEGQPLTASDILRIHNEKNPDRQYASQQSFIRPLVIGAIGKKKITYDELPFSASQKDVSTGFEKATGVVTPSQGRGEKFGRDIEYTAATQANPDYALPADRAALAAKTLDYKRAREAYRKADNAEGKQQYIDKMQSMVANDDELGQEIAQQYADGLIQTQDPVTLELAKKFRITKKKYGIPKISDKETRDAAAVVGAEDTEEEV